MGTRLLRIGHPVNECQFAGIVDRGQEFESGMQSGKSIAQRERVGVGEGGSVSARFRKQRFALHIPALRGIDWDGDVVADFGAVGVVAMGDDVVEPVIGPAQKDEEQFLDATIGAGLSEPAFCERLWTKSGTSVSELRAAVAARPVAVLKKSRRVRIWGVFMARELERFSVPDLIVPENGVNSAVGRRGHAHGCRSPWFREPGSRTRRAWCRCRWC